MFGTGRASLNIMALRVRQSIQIHGEPSCFVTTTIGELHGDSEGSMMPFAIFSSRNSLILMRSAGEYFRDDILIVAWLPVSMVKGRSFAHVLTGCVRSLQNRFSHRNVSFRKYHRFSRPCNSFPLLQSFGSSLSSSSTNSSNSFIAFSFFSFIYSFISIRVITSPLYVARI